jgi:hypothetical protein
MERRAQSAEKTDSMFEASRVLLGPALALCAKGPSSVRSGGRTGSPMPRSGGHLEAAAHRQPAGSDLQGPRFSPAVTSGTEMSSRRLVSSEGSGWSCEGTRNPASLQHFGSGLAPGLGNPAVSEIQKTY